MNDFSGDDFLEDFDWDEDILLLVEYGPPRDDAFLLALVVMDLFVFLFWEVIDIRLSEDFLDLEEDIMNIIDRPGGPSLDESPAILLLLLPLLLLASTAVFVVHEKASSSRHIKKKSRRRHHQ